MSRRRLRRVLLVLSGLVVLGLALSLCVRWHVTESTESRCYALDDAPARPVAIVLGAKVIGDRPSNLLEDRLEAALALYRSGRCEKLLLSGAHHREDYDEVGVMRQWLEARGVAPDDLYLDHAGLRTFDSMVRAKEVFGAQEVVVVSQGFHVPRAVYIGRSVGLDAIGVNAPAGYVYPSSVVRYNGAREHLAQVRAWLDLHVLPTEPKFLGEPISLESSGRVTH